MSTAAHRAQGDLPLLQPELLEELLQARSEHPDYTLLAGGTDLMVRLRNRSWRPTGLIDLSGLDELRTLHLQRHLLQLGALVTFEQLLANTDIMAGWPLMAEAAATVGAPQIRLRATIGGNIANASPAGDILPPLVVYGAELLLASVRGQRQVPLESFFRGYKQLDLAPDEVIVGVEVPRPAAGTLERFRKVGTRRAQAITKVSVAMTLVRDQRDGSFRDVRLSCGAVGPHVLKLGRSEALLEGQAASPELAEQVRRSVLDEVTPIDDVRATAAYRRTSAANIVARIVSDLIP